MQIVRLPRGNMSWIIQIRNLSPLKYLHHQVGIGDLFDVSKYELRRRSRPRS